MCSSDLGEGGSDVVGTTGRVPGVAGGAEGATSGIGSVEGTVGAGALMSAGILIGCGSSVCSGCGISGCSGPSKASGSIPYAVILVHLSRVNISRQIRLRSSWGSDGYPKCSKIWHNNLGKKSIIASVITTQKVLFCSL